MVNQPVRKLGDKWQTWSLHRIEKIFYLIQWSNEIIFNLNNYTIFFWNEKKAGNYLSNLKNNAKKKNSQKRSLHSIIKIKIQKTN